MLMFPAYEQLSLGCNQLIVWFVSVLPLKTGAAGRQVEAKKFGFFEKNNNIILPLG